MILHPANFLYWGFIAIGVIFFALIILSDGGEEEINLNPEAEIDLEIGDGSVSSLHRHLDVEIDADTDIDTDSNNGLNPWQLLSWLGLGKAPLMILLGINFSSWGMAGWIFNTMIYSMTGRIPEQLWGLGGLVLLLSLSIALLTGRLLSRPIGQLFASFGEDVSHARLMGCIGTVSAKKLPYLTEGKIGQVSVYDPAQNLVIINAALPHWATVIPHRGDQVLIIDQQEKGYLVIAKDSSDEDQWMNSSMSSEQ